MEQQPSLDILMKKVDSKYTLVVAVSKRARLLTEGEPKMVATNSTKSVTIALQELAANKLHYRRTKGGIK